jgi:Polyketide cyclase / dehydrase and lipid transport
LVFARPDSGSGKVLPKPICYVHSLSSQDYGMKNRKIFSRSAVGASVGIFTALLACAALISANSALAPKTGEGLFAAELESQIEINAPIGMVWAVLVDFKSYSIWNPFVRRIEGEAKAGTTLLTEIVSASNGNTMTFYPRVLTSRAFRWRSLVSLDRQWRDQYSTRPRGAV